MAYQRQTKAGRSLPNIDRRLTKVDPGVIWVCFSRRVSAMEEKVEIQQQETPEGYYASAGWSHKRQVQICKAGTRLKAHTKRINSVT